MRSALIGHTGFVGGALARDWRFDEFYNSKNIDEIGGEFDWIVCAGSPGTKWVANAEPEADRDAIDRLIDALCLVSAKRFVLISTVDVYGDPRGVTEADAPLPRDSYGAHRLRLEAFISQKYRDCTVLRLPSLFGRGLKKNPLFDLMRRHRTAQIVPNAVYQWFPVARVASLLLWPGRVYNIVSEPLSMDRVRNVVLPSTKIGLALDSPPAYDVRSLYGMGSPYHLAGPQVLWEMKRFVASERV